MLPEDIPSFEANCSVCCRIAQLHAFFTTWKKFKNERSVDVSSFFISVCSNQVVFIVFRVVQSQWKID